VKNIVKFSTIVGVTLALIIIPIVVYYVSLLQQKDQIKEQVMALSAVAKPLPTEVPEKISQLGKIVAENFSEKDGDYAVVIKNLKTNEEYSFNERKKFNSASLYKLWVMGDVFQKIKDGEIDENQILSADVKKLDETLSTITPTPTPEGFVPEPTTGEEEKISMTVAQAIEKMIKFSDNYAALLLASRAGTFSVTNFLKKYELNDSSFRTPPKTSAKDTAIFFEKLYKGEIVDKEYSDRMIEILKLQTINDRIPKQLPEGAMVAHKTGELFGSKHDAGIVYSDKGNYIIVVLSDTKNSKIASEKIARFSKEIYDYFNSN
jgi:beta-lactamase class A